jgi:hypothetical protein
MRLFGRSRPVANDNGTPSVAKKELRSSRRVATQTTGDTFFQRLGKIVRPRKVAPIPVIKPESDVLKNISRRSRTSKGILFDDNKIYSPFDLELPHSTSRNRTSKRYPLQDRRDQQTEGIRNLLQILDSSPKTLNHITLTKYLNRPFDLSGITEIKLYGKDLPKTPIYNKIIELLKSILQQSKNIETIEIDVPYLIPVLLELTPKLSTIQGIKKLILRSDYESPKPITDDVIFHLLSMIGKMNNLEELEFSKFEIDVSKFKGGITFNDLFRSIVKLEKLTRITFNDNVFTDNVKEGEFDNFHNKYFRVYRTYLDRIRILVEWIINNIERKILGFNAYEVYKSSEYWNNYLEQKRESESERKQITNLPKISDVSFEDFLKDDEAVKGWFKWLIINKSDIHYIGDIVERLRIVIGYFKYNIDSIMNLFEENQELQTSVIRQFNRNVATKYKPRPNDEYNRIITDIIGNKLIKSRGGRKAPKKPPKQPTKPPKVSPKKQPKQPTKPPKAPKKTPKVARKTNKKK